MAGLQIALADPSFAAEKHFVGTAMNLINHGFAETDSGMWRPGSTRVTTARVTSFVAAGELLAAYRDGELAGVARIRLLSPVEAECTHLVRAESHSGRRLGTDLLASAEQWALGWGALRMRTELLTVRAVPHPGVDQSKTWLQRHGYHHLGTADLADWRPETGPHLATECDYLMFAKDL